MLYLYHQKRGETKMKAYVEIFKRDGSREKHVWTLDEAKKNLTEKQFETLCSWTGLHTSRINGYIA